MKLLRSATVVLCGMCLAFLLSLSPFADNIDRQTYDTLLTATAIPPGNDNDEIIIVGIGDDSLDNFKEPLVLWHRYFAAIIEGLADSGAKGVAVDIIPSISLEGIAPDLDRKLLAALRKARDKNMPVHLGFKAGAGGLLPHRKFLFFSSEVGFLNLFPDSDGKIRRQPLTLTGDDGREAHSISALLAGAGFPLPTDSYPQTLYIDYRISAPNIVSFFQVVKWVENNRKDKLSATFGGKRVFIGVTSRKLPEYHAVPSAPSGRDVKYIPGVLLQSLSAKTVISGNFLVDAPPGMARILAISLGIISGTTLLFLSPLRGVVVGAFLLAAVLLGAFLAFNQYKVIHISAPFFFIVVPGLVSATYSYTLEYRQFRHLQRFFKSYVHPQVMEEILRNPGMVSFAGQGVVATVMFADIRNYSTLAEKLAPEAIITGLNRYFEKMTKAVIDNNGYLNQYYGDGFLAIFGAPNPLPGEGAMAAVRCGLGMLEDLVELNESEIFPGVSGKVKIGIGIHSGEAVVGNLGCHEKMDYAIVGDTVNLASRIEGLTKEYNIPMLISEATYHRIKSKIDGRFVGKTRVKGREEEISLYEVLSLREQS